MDDHASVPTRRCLLLGAASVGAAATSGCLDLGSSGGDGSSHRGICSVVVGSSVDESAGETSVRIEVRRDGERVYDETHELASSQMVLLRADEREWLGDDVPYRITVAPDTDADSFVYDTGEAEPARECRGFFATYGSDGISAAPTYGSTVDDRTVGQR